MISLYAILIRIAVPFMVLRLLWRSRTNPAYRRNIRHRLGVRLPEPAQTSRPRIWIHAVSVGETLAIAPLIEKLLADLPTHRVLVTSTTPTGADQVVRLFADRVDRCWVPFDTPGSVARFLDHWQPGGVLLVETEVWPAIILQSRRRGLPVVLLNARLSRRSARGYARIAPLARPVLRALSHVACQQLSDARRFKALGVAPDRLSVAGSIKFDLPMAALTAQRDQLAADLDMPTDRPVLVAGSTHPGEEAQVLDAFDSVSAAIPGTLLVLAPRHPERTGELAQLLAERGLRFAPRSDGVTSTKDLDVLILDTLGELGAMTGIATVVFVGGSLVPHGGHNPLEAAAFGVPILCGPHHFNFADIYRQLFRCSGARLTNDREALARVCVALLTDPSARAAMSRAASAYQIENRGALERQYTLVERALSH